MFYVNENINIVVLEIFVWSFSSFYFSNFSFGMLFDF